MRNAYGHAACNLYKRAQIIHLNHLSQILGKKSIVYVFKWYVVSTMKNSSKNRPLVSHYMPYK